MRRSGLTTLSDVAKEAGVTAMTVSVVLNGARSATRVSDATRLRIEEAATRLNYRPNAVARGLSRRRMDTLGVVSVIDGVEVNYYFLELLNGILEGAKNHKQNTTIFSVPDWKEDDNLYRQFSDGRVDGLILVGPLFSAAFAEKIAHNSITVSVHPNETAKDLHNITSDDEGGMYKATRFVIDQGHTDIAHIAGPHTMLGGRLRYTGFRRAMQESGLPINPGNVREGHFSIESGQKAVREMIEERGVENLPTAIICASDAMAYGCMDVLTNAGLSVPGDISVVGFDDTMLARVSQPPLVTVRQPLRRMGQRAVDLLVQQIKADQARLKPDYDLKSLPASAGVHSAQLEVFDVELVVRRSVGPPPVR